MNGSLLTRIATGFSKPERLVKKANRYEDSGNHTKAFELRKECYEYCVSHLGEEAPETLTHPDTERARKYCETIDKIKETEDLLHRTGKHR